MRSGRFTGVNALMVFWIALAAFDGWQIGKYGAFVNIVAAMFSLALAVAFGCFVNVETARIEGEIREMDRREKEWRR